MRRLLVVDDDRRFSEHWIRQLEPLGIHGLVAGDAKSAFKRLEENRYDDVILEPGLGGHVWYTLLDQVIGFRAGCRVHIATAFASSALRRRAWQVGVYSFFVKPVEPTGLRSALSDGKRVWNGLDTAATLAVMEWEHLNTVIHSCDGNAAEAAVRLGIPRQTLYRKLRKYSPLRSRDELTVIAGPRKDGLLDTVPPS